MSEHKTMARSSNKDALYVAVDDGYAMTKVALPDGTLLKLPSTVRDGSVTLSGDSDEIPVYRTAEDGGDRTFSYTNSSDVGAAATDFDTYPFSARNRVMVHHALIKAGLGGRQVKIVTSLPVHDFYGETSKNQVSIDRKNVSIRIPVAALGARPCAEIVASTVLSEGVCAWLDHALGDDGQERVTLDSPAAVIDIGGRTTDTVKILGGLSVDRRSSGTKNLGVLDLIKALRPKIAGHPEITKIFGTLKDENVSRKMVEDVIQTLRFARHNLDIPMSEIVADSRRSIAVEILDDIERRIAKGFDLQALLFVGGGSVVFREEILSRFPSATFVEGPEYANARGMLKYMRRQGWV